MLGHGQVRVVLFVYVYTPKVTHIYSDHVITSASFPTIFRNWWMPCGMKIVGGATASEPGLGMDIESCVIMFFVFCLCF